MVKDNISDFLIKLKNAGTAGKDSVDFPQSKIILAIAELLAKEGYVSSVEKKVRKGKKMIELVLSRKEDGRPKIIGVRRVSKLSKRVYEKARNIKVSRSGMGSAVLSTPKGIMTDRIARKEKVGGELLFKIW